MQKLSLECEKSMTIQKEKSKAYAKTLIDDNQKLNSVNTKL